MYSINLFIFIDSYFAYLHNLGILVHNKKNSFDMILSLLFMIFKV